MNRARIAALPLLAAVIACSAGAQQGKRAPWAKEPEAVFGVRLGQPLDLGDLPVCDHPEDKPKIAFCRTDSMGYSSPYRVEHFPVTVFREGMLTVDGGVVSDLLIQGDHDDYAEIRSILIERYGPPTSRQQLEVKNGVGASFPSEQLRWIGRRVVLTLKERSGRLDQVAVFFTYLPAAAKSGAERQQRAKSDASKM